MNWQRINAYCIRAGEYRISRYTLGGEDLYIVYHGDTQIGTARNGNEARGIADRHAKAQS